MLDKYFLHHAIISDICMNSIKKEAMQEFLAVSICSNNVCCVKIRPQMLIYEEWYKL